MCITGKAKVKCLQCVLGSITEWKATLGFYYSIIIPKCMRLKVLPRVEKIQTEQNTEKVWVWGLASLQIQLPVNVYHERQHDGSSIWSLPTTWETCVKFWAPDFSLPQHCFLQGLEEQTNKIKSSAFLCLYFILFSCFLSIPPICFTVFQIK